MGFAVEDRVGVGGRSSGVASDVVDEVPRPVVVAWQGAVGVENTFRLAGELGLLEGTVEQIIDSTPMLGAAATQDTVRLVRHGVKKLIDAVAAVDSEAGERLADGLEFDYAEPNEKPDARWRERAERERMLTRVAQDAERALTAVEQAEGLLEDEQVKAAHQLLRELIGQDFEVDDDGVPRLFRGTRQGRIISTVDPEMRHGRKSSQQLFDGYKLSAAATNTSEPLITAVDVCPASETDGPQAKHLIDSQPPEQRPDRILGDTAYGNGPVRAELAERDVDVLAPVPEGKIVEGRLSKHEFSIDLDAGTVTCPGGQTVPISTTKTGFRQRVSRQRSAASARSSALLPRTPATSDQSASTRGPSPGGPSGARRSGHRRAPQTHTTADRAAPGPARASVRRSQEPLHRQREGPIASRVGRSPGQPQPDRPPAGRSNGLGRPIADPIEHPSELNSGSRPAHTSPALDP